MMRKVARICFQMSAGKKIPRPRDPSVSESFETKLSDQQVKILIDPKGFMTEEQKEFEKVNVLQETNQNQQAKVQNNGTASSSGKAMQPEYGFKPKGPQPTRYGDWQRNGKCVDF